MRFVCDSTVGKLARLLRMAGFDTAFVSRNDLAAVLAISKEEGRMIITRNSKYITLRLANHLYLLTDDEPFAQFRKVAADLKLLFAESEFLTRCLECNEPLVEIDKGQVRERLYEFVAKTQERIFLCPRCDRLYWCATHARAMTKRLLAIKKELDRKLADEAR